MQAHAPTLLTVLAVALAAGCGPSAFRGPAGSDASLALVAVSRLPEGTASARYTLLGAELVPRQGDRPDVALLPLGARMRTLELAWARDGITARLLDGSVPPGDYGVLLLTLRSDRPEAPPRLVRVRLDRPLEARPGVRTTMVVEFDLTRAATPAIRGSENGLVVIEVGRSEARESAGGDGIRG